ncbi:putative HTH-type transcriptional regulator YdfH [compost metagenome]
MFELDEQFHRILFEGCHKLWTWSVIQQMNAHLNRSRMLWLQTDPNWARLFKQHQEMYEAISSHNGDLADRIMQEHLTLSISDLELLQKKFPDYYHS